MKMTTHVITLKLLSKLMIGDPFVGVTEMVKIGSGTEREVDDVALLKK